MVLKDEGKALRSHLSGSVPVSIGVHAVVLLLFFVVPLSNLTLPKPFSDLPVFVKAAPLPPPPAPAPPAPRSPAASVPSPSAGAPTKAPDSILPEPARVYGPPDAPGVPGGLPSDIGGVGHEVSAPTPPPVPDPPRPATPVRATQLPVMPQKIVDVRPIYPEIARTAKIDGTVIIEALIDTSGRVTQARVLRSIPMLDQAAIDAVRAWRYTPSTYNGRAVSVLMTVTIRFTLQQ